MRDSLTSWQKILAEGFASAAELLTFLNLPTALGNALAEKQFRTRVPRGFAARMQPENPRDPLLLQVLAVEDELQATSDYTSDPLLETKTNPQKGLIHKYHGRVLLTLTGACAVNCRYCFRRHFPYQDNNPGRQGWRAALDYIAQDSNIHEVILSGGDPLLAKDHTLKELVDQLSLISHVNTLRIHTRIPIVLPERITDEFIAAFSTSRLQKVMVLHCNHAQELDKDVLQACVDLRQANFHLLNQSVLLAGVNDNAQTLAILSKRLFAYGVMPYYLHLLDKVQGAAHFDLPVEKARQLFYEMQALLPGYLVPRLAREVPGETNKVLVI